MAMEERLSLGQMSFTSSDVKMTAAASKSMEQKACSTGFFLFTPTITVSCNVKYRPASSIEGFALMELTSYSCASLCVYSGAHAIFRMERRFTI